MAKHVIGLKGVKFGTPTGTAAMPVTMEAFAGTVEGSMTLSESEATIEKFKEEESVAPVAVSISAESEMEIVWKCHDLSPSILAKVKGGTATATKWTAPTSSVVIELAVELESLSGAKILIPKATIIARIDGTIGRGNILQMEVKATPMTPDDGGAPFDFDFTAAV